MDIFRLPKFSYYFYRSQRDPGESGAGWNGGPMVFIASHWTPAANLRVLVFSNCEEVALSLNGVALSRQTPSRAATTQYLPHPPFVFDLPRFEPGRLEAVGLIGGQACASHQVGTPGAPARLELVVDETLMPVAADEPDLLFAHACWRDENNQLCVDEVGAVNFTVAGDAVLVGPARVGAEAGVASNLLRLPSGAHSFQLSACASEMPARTTRLIWLKDQNPIRV
jgi:beta-galactosidase